MRINFYEECFTIEFFLFGAHSFCGKPFREEEYRGEKCEEKAQWEHPVKYGLHYSFQIGILNILIRQFREHISPYTSTITLEKTESVTSL